MDITRMLRYGRFLLPPFMALLAGLAAMAWAQRGLQQFSPYLGLSDPLTLVSIFAGAGVSIAGGGLFAWNVYRLYRRHAALRDGECLSCHGDMRRRDGWYGAYRVCDFCGAKREGWR